MVLGLSPEVPTALHFCCKAEISTGGNKRFQHLLILKHERTQPSPGVGSFARKGTEDAGSQWYHVISWQLTQQQRKLRLQLLQLLILSNLLNGCEARLHSVCDVVR